MLAFLFLTTTASAWTMQYGRCSMPGRTSHFAERRGSTIVLRSQSKRRSVMPKNIPLDVVFEDEDLLVINKLPGMTVQFANEAVEQAVCFYLNSTSSQWSTPSWPWRSSESFEGIVHRLDKGTSGLLAVGKHPQAARALAAAFRDRRVNKTYLAIAVGMPSRRSPLTLSALATANSKASKSPTRSSTATAKAAAMHRHREGDHAEAVGTATEDAEGVEPRLVRAINGCGQDGERALALLEQAVAAGERPSASCYSAAMNACVQGGSAAGKADKATVTTPRRDRVTSRRASMHGAEAAGQREASLTIFDSMSTHGVTPSAVCFQIAIGLCSREPPLWQRAVELVDRMEASDVGITAHCVSSAISACGRAGELDAAMALLDLSRVNTRVDDGTCTRAAIRAAERCGAAETARALAASFQLQSSNGGGGDPAADVAINEAVVIDAPIGKLGKYTMGLMAVADGGREALSVVTPIAFDGTCSLSRVAIETGRTHQIRVHMASVLGCPLAGDADYGRPDATRRRAATSLGTHLGLTSPPVDRVMLHAAELTLPHPITGATIRLRCAPPPDFLALAGTMMP